MGLFGIDPEHERAGIQALRADPPGLARRGARRSVFGAALEQWDALLRASATVGPESSPILLFYALSQASRGLCAACIRQQPWRPSSHGLQIGEAKEPFGDTLASPSGGRKTSFAMFCRALGTPPLAEPVRLGTVWAANPFRLDVAPGLGDGEPRALLVTGALPRERAPWGFQLEGAIAEGIGTGKSADEELCRRLDGSYPGTAEGVTVTWAGQDASGKPCLGVVWRDQDDNYVPLRQISPGPDTPTPGQVYLRPSLNRNGETLPALGCWWVILLTLSSVARYEPDRWRALLARDRARTAVPIERCLDHARAVLPWLLREALTASPA